MKNYLLIIFLFVISLGCSQQATEADKTSAQNAIKGFYSAAEDFDFDAMRTFCTADFHAIEDGYTYNNLDEFIAMAESFKDFTPQINLDFVKTDVEGKMAMSIVKFDAQFKNEETQMNLKTIENYLLKKVEGKWLIDFFQSTYLTDTKKLEKGSILGIHGMSDIELKTGVTNAQVEEFLLNIYIPALDELTEDFKAIPLKGLRGDYKDKFGFIMYFSSEEVRNAYWESEDRMTQKGQDLFEKFQPILTEQEKLFTINKDPYTDWRIE
jgi:hypothetical protein